VCSPDAVKKNGWGGFSAIGYFFGRELQHKLNVPIGLVEVAWGGTSAEAWTSADALRPLNDFDGELDQLAALNKAGGQPVGTYVDLWMTQNDAGSKAGANWQSTDLQDADWKSTDLPDGFSGLGISGKKAVGWFRKEVALPDPLPDGTATLSLGRIQSNDTTWVNGKLVGTTNGGFQQRRYWLPPDAIKPGKNLIAVRVLNSTGKGGFTSGSLFIQLGDGKRIPLDGVWKGNVGGEIKAGGPVPKDFEPNPTIPAVLSNGMIAPLAPMAIRGVIWYQGETNSGRGYQYRRLLPAMIADWRHMFHQGDFPFYIVSLAAFMRRQDQPGDDGWAELREAQAMAATHVRKSGLAIAIDVGSATDVHPKDKKTVGERLAAVALANEYRMHVPYSGPVYRDMRVEGGSIRLRFDHTDQGLIAKGGDLEGFAIAGADHKWHWANARIDGETIVVSANDVPNPVAVRYAWASNPAANLYNGAGLPGVPFRTDDWKMVSVANK